MNNFTVFVLNCYNEVTTVCRFSNKEIPSTLQQFWLATGVDERISNYGKARVTVSMEEGWSKLDANPKSTVKYIFDSRNGAMFQLSPFHTPTSSPLDGADKEGVEKVETQFRGVVEELFKPNPFANGIPSVYEDTTLEKLRAFFQRQPDEHNTTDSDVLALILAMPGSGKTRTVVEAARGKNTTASECQIAHLRMLTPYRSFFKKLSLAQSPTMAKKSWWSTLTKSKP